MHRESEPGQAGRDASPAGLAQDPMVRRLVKNTLLLLSAKGFTMPLSLAEAAITARMLGPEGFGLLGVVIAFSMVAGRITSFRMNDFTVKYLSDALVAEDPERAGATFKAALLAESASSILAFALACLAAPLAATHLLKDPAPTPLIWLYSLVILGNATLETTTGALQVFDRFAAQAKVNVLRRVLYLLGVLVAWALSGGVLGVLVAFLLGNTIANAAQASLALREATLQIGPAWWRAPLTSLGGQWKEMRNFALITNLGSTLALIVRDSDLLLVGYFLGTKEVGFYKLALQLLKIPFATGTPMMNAIFPEIARTLGRGEARASRRLLWRGTLVAAAWVLPLALGTLLLMPWVIESFFGPQFLPAVVLVYILLIGNTSGKLFFWSRPTLLALGRADIPFKITLLHTVLKVLLAFWLLPTLGYTALAWILTCLMVLSSAISLPCILSALGAMEAKEATKVPTQ